MFLDQMDELVLQHAWTYPYTRNFYVQYYANGGWYRCSGALISRIHVLTAADALYIRLKW